ncbi:GlxA family transcriptional regulator [Micromonospora sp. 067-2]|uniref:GlxA family transcriptional regulator n=1 Tax=Micromonospora sp. 067-2 TaxID=2789270 RepID=UPI00397B51F0
MHTVAVLALPDVVPFDLSVPLETFGRTRLADGTVAYSVLVCGPAREVPAGPISLLVPHGLDALRATDTIVIPGMSDPSVQVSDDVLDALRMAAARGVRLASICVGAFTLAATGLLDGQRATTHWLAAPTLAARHPAIHVDPDVLYVDNGQLLTSAGAAAGLDLCLHMIRNDHGAAVAADVARLSVMPPERSGGQAQFIVHEPPTADGSSLEPVLAWLERNANRELALTEIAGQARMSIRTLNRRFREQTGTTPLQWLHQARLRRARILLETTDEAVESIGSTVGFGSPTAFRDRFRQHVGTSPYDYRRAFRRMDPRQS